MPDKELIKEILKQIGFAVNRIISSCEIDDVEIAETF
jgi:hypothetical protein